MAVDSADIRYRGDAADVEELFDVYRVGDFLAAYEENQRHMEQGLRDQLMSSGILLSQQISPRIFELFGEVCAALEFASDVEVFCMASAEINAMAAVEPCDGGFHSVVGITAAALEALDDQEIRALLGHELGHFLFENHRLNALLVPKKGESSATVLPALGESLFLRWRKKSEISADRMSLLASGDFASTARCLMKAHFGLSSRNLNLDVPSLMRQIDEIRGSREIMQASFHSHPLLPIRLSAIELFSRSEKAGRNGHRVEGVRLTDDELEDGVDALVQLTQRAPGSPRERAVMELCAAGGVLVLGADKEIGESEVKMLIELLHHHFTDEPEVVIDAVRDHPWEAIASAAEALADLGDEGDRTFVLSRLADVALADGALVGPEGSVILEIAEKLGIPSRTAYSVMVGAAQQVGFRFDAKLNRIADRLREQLGFGPARLDLSRRKS